MKHFFVVLIAAVSITLFSASCAKSGSPSTTTAAFTPTATASLTVTFTNTSVNLASDTWDFGDGNTSTEISPVHKYTTAGTYTVTLNVVGKDGVKKNMTHTVVIS